jgi:hypothetical protein
MDRFSLRISFSRDKLPSTPLPPTQVAAAAVVAMKSSHERKSRTPNLVGQSL